MKGETIMNEKQMQAARDAMIEWLEHPHDGARRHD